jgi:hypothetical protein
MESALGTKGIYQWVYVSFHLQGSWKGIDYIPIFVPSLFVKFSYCPVQEDLICCHLTCPRAAVSSFR